LDISTFEDEATPMPRKVGN